MSGYIGSKAVFLSTTAAVVDGNITVSGSVDGVDIAARDSVLTSTTTTANAALPKAGGTMTGNLGFGDNDKAIFGAGSDLQIYHNGSNSVISDAGAGNLYVYSDQFIINNYPDTQNMARFVSGGASTLYHAGSSKIATSASGIDVTGTVTADSLAVSAATNNYASITATNNNTRAGWLSSGKKSDGTEIKTWIRSEGDGGIGVVFTETNHNLGFATNNAAPQMTLNTSGNVGIGTNSPANSRLYVSGSGFAGQLLIAPTTSAYVGIGHGTDDPAIHWQTGDFRFATSTARDLTGFSEKMRITNAGNVGIGNSAPANTLVIRGASTTGGGSTGNVAQFEGPSGTNGFQVFVNDAANNTGIQSKNGDDFLLNPNGGNVLVGTSVQFDGSNPARLCLQSPGTGGRVINSKINTTASANHISFYNAAGQVGRITTSGSSTSYVTSSDYRLKTDAQPMTGASARVQALNPVNFEWLSDGTRVDGFLAHEAATVVPEAVSGDKDAMQDEEYEVTAAIEATYDDDGNELTAAVEAVMGTRSVPDMQGIDQSKIVPLLTAALQEALTEIASLKTRVAALEGN